MNGSSSIPEGIIPVGIKLRFTVATDDATLRSAYKALLKRVSTPDLEVKLIEVDTRAPLITHDEIQDLLVALWGIEKFGHRYWMCVKLGLHTGALMGGDPDRQRVINAWEPCFAPARTKLVAILQALQVCDTVNPPSDPA